jgi:hypothetical protein
MGSLPLLPVALEEADDDASLRMHELRAWLFRPPDMLPCSHNGVNLFCRSIAAPLAVAAPPRANGTVGGACVPKLNRVTAIGAPVPPRVSYLLPRLVMCLPRDSVGRSSQVQVLATVMLVHLGELSAASFPPFLHPC